VVILAATATLSDAVATAVGNIIITPADIPLGIQKAQSIRGVKGILIIKDDQMGIWGEVRIKRTELSP
jgi:ApbE superfamily uncharacterized protein (UPF0280 family)